MRLILRLMDEEQREPPWDTIPGGPSAVEEHQGTPLTSALTAREVEVLRQLAQGHSNQQIAHNLFITVSTVKKHVRQIISKLGVSDRTQAAILAIESGIRLERDK